MILQSVQQQIETNQTNQSPNLKSLLSKIGFYTTQEFLASDPIDYKFLQQTKYLNFNQINHTLISILNQTISLPRQTLFQKLKNLQLIQFPKLEDYFYQNNQFWSQRILIHKIYELSGKIDSGKSYLCQQIMKESINNQINVFYFCIAKSVNFKVLAKRLNANNQLLDKIKIYHIYPSSDMAKKFIYLLYDLGNQLILNKKNTIIIVDTLSILVQSVSYEKQMQLYLQLKKIMTQIVHKSNTSIIYTTYTKSNLFQLKHEKIDEKRFRCRHLKIWDSLADITIGMETVLINDTNEWKKIQRLFLSKSIGDPRLIKREFTENSKII